jgi:two-component system, response regulator PdtaR
MSGERILIVEDEAITGMTIREMVRMFGYEPHGPVVSGQAAVTSALALRPDVILMDIMLKGPMNGIQAARAIRAQYCCPVIYLTGSSDQVRADLVQLTELFDLVLKPIGEQELHAAIKTALHANERTPGCPLYAMPSEAPERTIVWAAEDKPTRRA